MNWLTNILETYRKGTEYDNLKIDNTNLAHNVNALNSEVMALDKEITDLKTTNEKLTSEILEMIKEQNFPIDEFLSSKYKVINNIAYKDKREYSVFLNQMITPDSFEVIKFKKQVNSTNLYTRIAKLGDLLAKHTKWVNEQDLYDSGDRYLYPEETLTFMKLKCDCEDVSNVMSSFEPLYMGTAYGFYVKNSVKFGHCFPVFLYKDELFIVETTGNSVEITNFNDVRYITHFIVTKNKTYQLRTGVSFGKLAEWR